MVEFAVDKVPSLDLLNIEERRLIIGEGDSATGFDLFWSIHCHSLRSSMGLTSKETTALKHYCRVVFDEFIGKSGTMIPYISFVVRKKS